MNPKTSGPEPRSAAPVAPGAGRGATRAVAPPHPAAAPTPAAPGSWTALGFGLAWRGVANPRLGLDLVRTVWAFRRRDWWRRSPFLPIPDRPYLRWRMYTAYADPDAIPSVEDVIRFARWRRTTMGV